MRELLPLTMKKIEILRYIYENQPVHLRKIALELKIHPYQAKKIIDTLLDNKLLERQSAGRTMLLHINELAEATLSLLCAIEWYKQDAGKALTAIIKQLREFSKNTNIRSCCLFGSYARGAATKESDVDVLFVVKQKPNQDVTKKLAQLGTLLKLNFSPIIMTEEEFATAVKLKEPAIETILLPSQRIIIFGIENFLRITRA